jgi:hypothetical protein
MDDVHDIPPGDYTIHKSRPGDGGEGEAPKPRLVQSLPYQWVDPADIPPRQFLYGQHFIRGYMSLDVAGGGVGKTAYKIVEALAIVTGRPLLGAPVKERLRFWLWNLEDPLEEMTRRIQAVCHHYGIERAELGDRLRVNGREHPLCISETNRGGVIIRRPIVEAIIEEVLENRIDVMNVDPFISSHTAPENDNTAMDMVAKQWGRIATDAHISLNLTHHTRKANGTVEIDAESARGAKALIDAARSVRVLNRMTPVEAANAGVESHRSYFRVGIDKANMTPPPEKSDWYRIIGVTLANGDNVGVVIPWEWPDAFKGVTPDHTLKVQKAVHAGNCRKDIQSPQWVGNTVAEVLGLDPKDPAARAKIRSLLAAWFKEGLLVEEEAKDAKGTLRKFVRVGRWVEWAGSTE